MAYSDDIYSSCNMSNFTDLSVDDYYVDTPLDIDDSTESQLCIPQDPLEDVLEWYPSFDNDLISLVDLRLTPRHESLSFNDVRDDFLVPEEEKRPCGLERRVVGANKKQRSKRVTKQPCPWFKEGAVIESMETVEGNFGKKRCTHCQSENTPQWRIGPLGPKTLCNACGVRYRSGRLVPEYRPAASPSFNVEHHSNFHKKILKMKGLRDNSNIWK